MTTVDKGAVSVVLDLPIEPVTTVSALRGHLSTMLDDVGEDHLCDVQLVMTELVSNVLDHTAGTGRLRVLRTRVPCVITVEVDDTSELQPVLGRSRLGEVRGRGIVVVEHLAVEWGVRPLLDGGKTVYAALECPPSGS